MKFAWVFQYIYSFRRQFRRQFSTVFYVILQVPSLELRQLPSKFGGVWLSTSKVNNGKNTKPTLWQRRRSVFRWYLSQFSTVLHVILHTPFAAIAATALKNLVRFYRVFQKLLVWCTWNNTVSTSPERWKCGPSLKQHWGSALPPSYMCDWAVRTDKAGRQDWESNYQHYIDIGPISFFFFKIWYLAENKREKIAFPKYPLLREM